MADMYTQFSEVLTKLTDEEASWLKDQLQMICVFDGQEYPMDALPAGSDPQKANWRGCRGLRDLPDYDPAFVEEPEFQFEFSEHDEDDHWGRHLWLYSEDHCNLDHMAHLVQKFLKQFRPHDCWSLTFAGTCSKPRVGEFSGGAIFVTAETVRWENAEDFIEREKAAFVAGRIGKPDELQEAGPTIVLSVCGGVVQGVFCESADADVVIVDWDAEASDPGSPGVVDFALDGKLTRAAVIATDVQPLTELVGTAIEQAIHAAQSDGIL